MSYKTYNNLEANLPTIISLLIFKMLPLKKYFISL